MISTGALLFIIGTTIVWGNVIKSKEPCDDHSPAMGYLPIHPFLSGLDLQQPMMPFPFPFAHGAPHMIFHEIPKPLSHEEVTVHSKPCVFPTTNIWPMVPMPEMSVGYIPCDGHTSTILSKPIEIPAPVFIEEVKEPFFIPPAPVLSPLKPIEMPEIPVIAPIVAESLPAPIVEGEILTIPPAPELSSLYVNVPAPMYEEPALTEWNEISYTPVNIPAAPELPAFVMPELPNSIVTVAKPTSEVVSVPCDFENSAPEVSIAAQEIAKPLNIPAAPELPLFVMPEIPSFPIQHEAINDFYPVLVPQFPTLPLLSLPEAPIATVEKLPTIGEVHENVIPMIIPDAPVLPEFTMPAIPTIQEPCAHVEIPSAHEVLINEVHDVPVEIPTAPELSPFVMPQLPILPEFFMPTISKPVPTVSVIPNAPELPQFIMPEIPATVFIDTPKPSVPCAHETLKPIIEIPAVSTSYQTLDKNIAYPCACVDAILQQRLIPNLAFNGVDVISRPSERHIYAFTAK